MASRGREESARALTFPVDERRGDVSALLRRPRDARWLLVLGHGAGAGMRHPFLEALSAALARHGVASLRYQFPYAERGSRRPDGRRVLQATVRAAVTAGAREAGGLPLLAGGKSMGGRMTSLAAAEGGLPPVRGLVFYGFPLHAAGRPSDERGAHLLDVPLPMLFCQGTRDRLAGLDLLRPLVGKLGRRAELYVVEEGDHSFRVPKRTGLDPEQVIDGLAARTAEWAARAVDGAA